MKWSTYNVAKMPRPSKEIGHAAVVCGTDEWRGDETDSITTLTIWTLPATTTGVLIRQSSHEAKQP